ncbi:MAG TPA: ABC transporter ATP-binding protein [Blastocatellia bacterium]|nr:ABC transporter ATP-binding protein [Blastocatellia bacterium]
MLALEINNLTKDYPVGFWKKRTVRSLDRLNLEVGQGEAFGFLGPNGAGKTTTLKILMRLIYPTAGEARILGRPLDDMRMRARIGYLPEQPYFYDYLTAREFLIYCGRLFDLPRETAARRAEMLLSQVGLTEAADKHLRKFSKGMLQRAGLAQALVNDPEVLFLDEPMSGLDPLGRREVRDLIHGLREQGKTVFFSSHVLSDVEALCDRVAILNRGKLVESGRLSDILGGQNNEMEVVARGVGEIALAEVRGLATSVVPTAEGARIRVRTEFEVEHVLMIIHRGGGSLVAVNPVRESLEDLFVREVGDTALVAEGAVS